MGFLGNLVKSLTGGGGGFVPTIEMEPAIAPVIAPMKAGDIRPALGLFHQSPDHELRFRLVEAAAALFGTEQYRTQTLDAWVNNTPEDTYARLVRARWRIQSAPNWRPDDPDEVADAARAANEKAAEFAAGEYTTVARVNPADPVPWALQLALPLIYELDDKKRLYGEVQQRGMIFNAHLAMFHASSAMWYGDHATALAFARGVSANAPVGSDAHVLIAHAHRQIYAYEKSYGDDKANADALLRDPATHAEVQAALERSIFSPQYRPGHWSLFCLHAAAAWFYATGNQAMCRTVLGRVGKSFDDRANPWNFSTEKYSEIRKWAGLPS